MTLRLHGHYGPRHTRVTMTIAIESKGVRQSESMKVAFIWIVLCSIEPLTSFFLKTNQRMLIL